MPLGRPQERTRTEAECRQCRATCDKLVEPAGCLAIGCRFLYTYEDSRSGGRYIGCMNKVFATEIDLDLLLLAEAGRGGFGGIKVSGRPLPQCQFTVERAYEGEGPGFECVNRGFFDMAHEHPESIRAFDLRNALT